MKYFRLILAVVLATMIFASPALAGSPPPTEDPRPSVSVQDAFCEVGKETSISVSFDDPTDAVDALVFSLDVSEGITATEVIPYPGFEGMIILDPTDSDGEVDFAAWVFGTDGTIPEGKIADITIDCADAGEYLVDFSDDPPPSAGADGRSIPMDLDTAQVLVKGSPSSVTLVEFRARPLPVILEIIHGWLK